MDGGGFREGWMRDVLRYRCVCVCVSGSDGVGKMKGETAKKMSVAGKRGRLDRCWGDEGKDAAAWRGERRGKEGKA